jgi:hypothetical protein
VPSPSKQVSKALIFLIIMSCGKEASENPASDEDASSGLSALALRDRKDLGPCNSKNRSQLVYISGEKKFVQCNETDWEDLDIPVGSREAPPTDNARAAIQATVENPGTNCSGGGFRVDMGSGKAIEQTVYICHGEDGLPGSAGSQGATGATGTAGTNGLTSLISIEDVAPGDECSAGGKRIKAGHDTNGLGVLSESAVTFNKVVCNGATGSQGPAGAAGPAGPQGDAGIQGLIGAQGSAGSNGFNTLVRISDEAQGVNCSDGGKKIETGLDNGAGGGIAGDGILQVGEVQQTTYVCNGTTGATGPAGALYLYDKDHNKIGYFITAISGGQLEGGYFYVYMAIRSLSVNKYSLFSVASVYSWYLGTNNWRTDFAGGSTGPVSSSPLVLAYRSNDCSGQGYLNSADKGGVELNLKTLMLMFSEMHVGNIRLLSNVPESVGGAFASYGNPESCSTNVPSHYESWSTGYRAEWTNNPPFTQSLAYGWYIGP